MSLSATYPNNDYGWGRVDALNAVVSVLHTGSISGVVRRSDTGAPIPFASVQRGFPPRNVEQRDRRRGRALPLYGATSLYTLTASAFGYALAHALRRAHRDRYDHAARCRR